MPDFTTEDLASASAGYWATLKKIRLQAGTFSFVDHEYQLEPMCSTARRKCVMKATQGGFTESEVLDSLHGMIFRILARGVLYLFPTADDVNDFSKSRFGPLILANPQSIGKYVKTAGKGTDTASLKKIHDAFLYLRGARLSQKIGDVSESVRLKNIPVDRVVFDEYDHMDEAVILKALGRMGHSKVKQERYLSNPLVPGEGIDKIFSNSDQRHWFRKCGCGEWTCAELSFPDCVKIKKDGTGYIGCNKCGKEVFIRDGEWVPSVRDNSNYMHGYRWSQLTSVFNDPAEILEAFSNPPEGNLADVYRLRLGLPYIAAEDRLVSAQVYDCCNNDGMYSSHDGPCAMGVDVGIVKHIIIGTRSGNNQFRILKVARLSDWNDIHDLGRKFHVQSTVIDIRPYQDKVKEFQSSNPKFNVFLCEYSDSPAFLRKWDIKLGVVKDYRTALFDETHRMVITPGMLSIPRICDEIKEFAKQMCNAYKLLETNKKTGAKEYRYKGKEAHYRNALNYFLLAASKNRIVRIGNIKTNQVKVISEYKRI